MATFNLGFKPQVITHEEIASRKVIVVGEQAEVTESWAVGGMTVKQRTSPRNICLK